MEGNSSRNALRATVYLRAEAKIEPLVCGWNAWIHLVSPAQHALNVLARHVPLMQSFVQNPAVHVAASEDRALFGGPFVHLPTERVPDVQRLLEETESRCAALIESARELRQLDRQLQETATGYSLSELYSRIPPSWCGLVEFLYDINNHPKLRICEELLYEENPSAPAQEIMLSLQRDEDRSFFMSTPRLRGADSLLCRMPFADSRLDLLSSMRTSPAPFEEAAAQFALQPEQIDVFRNLFTAQAPRRNRPEYAGAGVRLRYFGHACVLVQTANTSILIDPMLTRDVSGTDGRFTFHDLPDRLDYVVLSHNHQDHCCPEMLMQLRHKVGCVVVPRNNSGNIADPSMKLALRSLGFENVLVLDSLEELPVPGGRITSLPFPGEHVDLDIHSRQGIHVEILGKRLAFLVDSDSWDSQVFRRIVRRIGKQVDVLFIGMECHGAPLSWLYGPLLTKPISRKNDESRRLSGLDSERAWKVVSEFEPGRIFVYAMGQEPWLKYIMGLQYEPGSIQLVEVAAFLNRCKGADIDAKQLFISEELEL